MTQTRNQSCQGGKTDVEGKQAVPKKDGVTQSAGGAKLGPI